MSDLIYDLGAHTGQDSAFYLRLGYRVIAVEADPDLTTHLSFRFAAEIAAGRLVVLNIAIAEQAGQIVFYKNLRSSFWGTINPGWAARNRRRGADSAEIMVPAAALSDILNRYGGPHYLKVDLEGADLLALSSLELTEHRPQFISIEAGKTSNQDLMAKFDVLERLGYRRFQIVSQGNHRPGVFTTKIGNRVEHRFEDGASGPFGSDLPGNWVTRRRAYRRLRRIAMIAALIGSRSFLTRMLRRSRAIRRFLPRPDWHDIHAARD